MQSKGRVSIVQNQLPARVMLYVAGLFVMAIGVVLSLQTGLGASPFNSMCYALSQVFGLELGAMLNIAFLICIGLQVLLLNREFQVINLTQLIWAFLFSWFVDMTKPFLAGVVVSNYAGKLLLLAVSIFLIGLGIEIYTNLGLIPMPSDGLLLSLCHRLGEVPYHKIKIAFDCTAVGIGIVVSLVMTGAVVGIREGTLISALMVGTTTKLLRKPVRLILQSVLHRGVDAHAEASANE